MFSDAKMKEFKKIDDRIGVLIYAGKAVGVVAAYGEIDVLRAKVDSLEKELEEIKNKMVSVSPK